MEIKDIIKSNTFKKAIYIIGGLFILLFVFQAGMFVGFQKASFSNGIGEMYFRQMRGGGNNMMGIQRDNFANAHGAIGNIVSINGLNIVVEDRDGVDKTVKISSSTAVKGLNGENTINDLKTGDFIVVFGSPSDKDLVVDARLVRVLPPPPESLERK